MNPVSQNYAHYTDRAIGISHKESSPLLIESAHLVPLSQEPLVTYKHTATSHKNRRGYETMNIQSQGLQLKSIVQSSVVAAVAAYSAQQAASAAAAPLLLPLSKLDAAVDILLVVAAGVVPIELSATEDINAEALCMAAPAAAATNTAPCSTKGAAALTLRLPTPGPAAATAAPEPILEAPTAAALAAVVAPEKNNSAEDRSPPIAAALPALPLVETATALAGARSDIEAEAARAAVVARYSAANGESTSTIAAAVAW